MRTIRKVQETPAGFMKAKAMTVEELLTSDIDLQALAKIVQQDELAALVDEGLRTDQLVKANEPRREAIKNLLKGLAKELKTAEFDGTEATAVIKPSTSTEVDTRDLRTLLKKMSKAELFFDLVKVKLTDAKKYLGEVVLDTISKKEIETYGSISFKPKKKPK